MYEDIFTITVKIVAAYVIWIVDSLVVYSFLLRKAESISPYNLLKRRRIETESFRSRIDYHQIKLMVVWGVVLYAATMYVRLYTDFSHLDFDKIYAYAETMDKSGGQLYAVTFVFLLAEFFYTLGSKAELSEVFFESLKLNSIRLWSVICGVLSSVMVMRYDFLVSAYENMSGLGNRQIIIAMRWFCGSMLLLGFHVGLLLYALAIHMFYDVKSVRRRIATQLSFSEIYKSCVRGGSPELQRNILSSILEDYDIYSEKILGNRFYKAAYIVFASPWEKIYFSDDGRENGEKIWYRKSILRMYRLVAGAFVAEAVLFGILKPNCHGILKAIAFLPTLMMVLLAVFTLCYLCKTWKKNYNRVVMENYTSWGYVFSYRKEKGRGSGSIKQKIFSREDHTYQRSCRKEQSYIRIIMSFLEYIRQVNAYENLGARSDHLHRDLVNHIFYMSNLECYELAQYRSLLILYHFAMREEKRLLNNRAGGCDSVTEIEKQDFRYCVDGLDQKEKQRLHDFLYDVTLDYYGVEDSDIKAIDGSARRKYKANQYFEEYWKQLAG